jgi:hypothetical protein
MRLCIVKLRHSGMSRVEHWKISNISANIAVAIFRATMLVGWTLDNFQNSTWFIPERRSFILNYSSKNWRTRLCTVRWTTQRYMRFQALAVASMMMMMTVFWDVAPCSLVEVYWCFRGACCLDCSPDNGGSKHLWNVGKLLPDYTALQPKWHPSSYPTQWKPEILLRIHAPCVVLYISNWTS